MDFTILFQDIQLAMQWVQQHVLDFGGDNSRVALFSERKESLYVCVRACACACVCVVRVCIEWMCSNRIVLRLQHAHHNTPIGQSSGAGNAEIQTVIPSNAGVWLCMCVACIISL